MKALVHGSRVCQVEQNEFPVASPLTWVECDNTVTTAHTYIDGAFVAPVVFVPSHNEQIDTQIRAIEFRELAPRFNREATLVMLAKFYMAEKSVDFATAVLQMTTVGHAGYNAGFTKLKALDDTIRALRAQRLP